jgi:hypothetical protein
MPPALMTFSSSKSYDPLLEDLYHIIINALLNLYSIESLGSRRWLIDGFN